MININELTIKNNAIFNIVMMRPNLCRQCLERILNIKISDIKYLEHEKTLDQVITAKSIRLDVYCEDDNSVYNIELQNGIIEELPKRSRYYQSMIDIELLSKGASYSDLKNNFVIVICTFDSHHKKRHLYTFRNVCIEDTDIELGDCTSKIFLNTKGELDDIPKSLRNFLEYIDTGEVTDDYTKELEDTVIEVKNDKKWRNAIMTVEEYAEARAKHDAMLAREEVRDSINELIRLLIEDGRQDELIASTTDRELQDKLLQEYNLK
ncbi:MAG: Rpn family recombination-promoting nuclease/putative transposase [Eubacterium sp.]|nr:Rpn family recombination-promoting nuclease/putative transposase [Eubacterium sp.]